MGHVSWRREVVQCALCGENEKEKEHTVLPLLCNSTGIHSENISMDVAYAASSRNISRVHGAAARWLRSNKGIVMQLPSRPNVPRPARNSDGFPVFRICSLSTLLTAYPVAPMTTSTSPRNVAACSLVDELSSNSTSVARPVTAMEAEITCQIEYLHSFAYFQAQY
jgi:hypothetical protein